MTNHLSNLTNHMSNLTNHLSNLTKDKWNFVKIYKWFVRYDKKDYQRDADSDHMYLLPLSLTLTLSHHHLPFSLSLLLFMLACNLRALLPRRRSCGEGRGAPGGEGAARGRHDGGHNGRDGRPCWPVQRPAGARGWEEVRASLQALPDARRWRQAGSGSWWTSLRSWTSWPTPRRPPP